MDQETTFRPPTRLGLAIHLGSALLLLAIGAFGLWHAIHANIGPTFLLYLLLSLAAVALSPILAYQAFSLYTAYYLLDRDGVRLRWGLRREDIPINQILWLQPARSYDKKLRLPWPRLPGALSGSNSLPGSESVEYMATSTGDLLLLGTSQKIYAISPQETQKFIQAFQRLTELGSLSPIPASSVYPTFLLARVWSVIPARWIIITGIALNLVLLAWTSLVAPRQEMVSLTFSPEGTPGELVPAIRLMLLPVLSGLAFFADFVVGLFFFRRDETQSLAYLLWAGGTLTAFIFLIAAYFILNTT